MTTHKEGVQYFALNDSQRAIGGDLKLKDEKELEAAKREAKIPPFTVL